MEDLDEFFESEEEAFMYMPLILPYRSAWSPRRKISSTFLFERLVIRFKKSASKYYREAVYIASFFPDYTPVSKKSEYNVVTITTYRMLLEYKQTIYELFHLIYNWKKVDILLNDVFEDINTIRELLYILQISMKACDYTLPKIVPFDIEGVLYGYSPNHRVENELYLIIRELFPDREIQRHNRPSFLDNLELDIYIPNLSLAFEYQGEQHYKPVAHWGGEEGLIKRRLHDIKKKELCGKNKITLIEFRHDEKIDRDNVKRKISEYLK